MAASDLDSGRLKPVLGKYQLPATGIYIVYPSRRHLSAATKAFITFAAGRFAGAKDQGRVPSTPPPVG
jgi:DNA-binding transcriptional LysR family regulator